MILETGDEVSAESIVITGAPGSLPSASSSALSGKGPFFAIAAATDGTPPRLEDLERVYIIRLLDHAGGNRTQVARLLSVSYPTVA